MRNKVKYNKRNKLIYEAYCEQWGKGLRDDVIYEDLANVYFLQPKRIAAIVRFVKYEGQRTQTELVFDKKQYTMAFGQTPDGVIDTQK